MANRKRGVKKAEVPEDSPEIIALKAKVAKLEAEKANYEQNVSKKANFAAQIPGSGFKFGAASFGMSHFG